MHRCQKPKEPQLILALQQQDPQALAYLYDHYAAALYGIIHSIIPIEEVSEEVLQDCFLKIWNNIQYYDSQKGKLFTWMLHIAKNLAIDQRRSKAFVQHRKRKAGTGGLEGLHLAVVQTIQDPGLLDMVRQLTDKQQQVIQLVFFEGYTHQEVAQEYEIPLGTVKTRIRSALIKLRRLWKAFDQPAPALLSHIA